MDFKDLYFKELQKTLSSLGFEVNIDNNCANIGMMGDEIARIDENGVNIKNKNFRYYYNSLQKIVDEIKEYVINYYKGDELIIGKKKWKKIIEFNSVILVARKVTDDRYEFATWEKSNDAVKGGMYYTDYYSAKQDMAKRSGLIDEDKILNEKDMRVIYSKLISLNDKEVHKILDKISRIVPRVEECREIQIEK